MKDDAPIEGLTELITIVVTAILGPYMVIAGIAKACSGRYGLGALLVIGGLLVGYFGWLYVIIEFRRHLRWRRIQRRQKANPQTRDWR